MKQNKDGAHSLSPMGKGGLTLTFVCQTFPTRFIANHGKGTPGNFVNPVTVLNNAKLLIAW